MQETDLLVSKDSDNTSHPNAKFRLSDGRKNFSRFRFPRVLRWAGKQRIFKVVLDFYISPTDVQCMLFMTLASLRKSVLERVFLVFRHVTTVPGFVSRRCLFAISQINERRHEVLHYRSHNGNSLLQFYSYKFYSTPIFYPNFKMHVIRKQLRNSIFLHGMKSIHAMH